MKIKVITYDEERLNYFTDLMKKAQNRYERLYKKYARSEHLWEKELTLLSDAGREVQFCEDVVSMLKQGYRKQTEGEWIAKELTSISKRGRTIHYATYKCSVCGKWNGKHKQKHCPNCGAKMKGGAEL